MPSVSDFAAAIEEIAPAALAQEWDNSGTLLDCGGEVSGVLVSLDITDEVVNEAEAEGCQLIVAHHPVIFQPLRSLRHGDVVYRLVKKSISAICAHTNLDAAFGGVNDVLAALFGLTGTRVFAGAGRAGALPQAMGAAELARLCARHFRTHVRLCDAGRPVETLAVMGGGGGGLLTEALAAGAQAIVTGEADHHDAIDAKAAGVSMILAGHFASEFPVIPVLASRLSKRFSGVRVIVSRRGKDPFALVDAPFSPRRPHGGSNGT